MILSRLRRRPVSAERHSVPDGERVYAIGDIHGRLDLLDRLIRQIDSDDQERGASSTTLIFLGDFVDRGPDSRGVIDRVIELRQAGRRIRTLMGNHEEVFLKALAGDIGATRFLTRIGGRETIASYGVDDIEYRKASFEELTELLADKVPGEHVEFLQSLEKWVTIGDYLFVHAGLRPGIEIEEQSISDLCWIRGEFLLDTRDHGKMIVHGHSIRERVDIQANRIGIDTGAFASDRLTAIGLEGNQRWFLST
jgi:serine/threonine protein phosphatase 1